jgi:hypothetical protein
MLRLSRWRHRRSSWLTRSFTLVRRNFDLDTQPQDTIKTNPIYGSDAATSTYGLDPARVVDW